MKMPNQIHPIQKITSSTLMNLPTPTSISYMWNWGSMLGLNLVIQIITGILLASHYNSDVNKAFSSMFHITREVEYGYTLRFIHMNGASSFFILIFIHISRSLNQASFKNMSTWFSGVAILLILMGTAFLGYVLPWGQMSFWGATVITNLISATPWIGQMIVQWLWGGFSIGMATLSRFFAIHFLMPFLLAGMILVHLASLHQKGSNLPSGMNPNLDKSPFTPFFSTKDIITALMLINSLIVVSMMDPFLLGDPENFNPANPLNTPPHIQPEWYFLFAYAILRAIPNKLGGVIALVSSIVSLSFLSAFKAQKSSKKFMPATKNIFWSFSTMFVILTFIGASPVEPPYEQVGKALSTMYFSILMLN